MAIGRCHQPSTVASTARLTVDLAALRANYRRIAAVTARCEKPPPAAVVKADGYGLGAPAVVDALRTEGCRDYFVATLTEGMALRTPETAAGVRVYVLSGPLDPEDATMMAEHDLIPVLNDERQLAFWQPHRARPAAVHVDTGMHRLGFCHVDIDAAWFAGFNIRLLLSHFANADTPDDAANARQVARFRAVAARFPDVPASLGNSAGALSQAGVGMARAGIALYGGNPFTGLHCAPLQVVATLEAQVVGLRDVPAGEPVGYGGAFETRRSTRLAVLGIGYADGLSRRVADGEVAFRGVRLPILGRVSMDLAQVDATAVAGRVHLGDQMEVFGATISVDEFAACTGTIGYEALTTIGPRVQRRYVGIPRQRAASETA